MDLEAQKRAPIYEALERFRKKRVVPFDVPGHKRGRGNPGTGSSFRGKKCVGLDVNSIETLDNLCHPVSVIREAEELAAEAFGASHAFLMVGGTTSAVQGMILQSVKQEIRSFCQEMYIKAPSMPWYFAGQFRFM